LERDVSALRQYARRFARLGEIEKRLRPNLLVLSEGEIETHRSFNLQSPILLDTNRNISKQLGIAARRPLF
jgi:hypothetical protein